jgi:hypothetical protein
MRALPAAALMVGCTHQHLKEHPEVIGIYGLDHVGKLVVKKDMPLARERV